MDHFNLSSQTSVKPATPFGTNAAVLSPTTKSTLGGSIYGSTNTYTFPVATSSGTFMFLHSLSWSVESMSDDTISYTNCSALGLGTNSDVAGGTNNLTFSSTGNQILLNATGTNPEGSTHYWFVTVTGAGASITWTNAGTASGTFFGADLYVVQMPANIN